MINKRDLNTEQNESLNEKGAKITIFSMLPLIMFLQSNQRAKSFKYTYKDPINSLQDKLWSIKS